jgi:hypothetical protein
MAKACGQVLLVAVAAWSLSACGGGQASTATQTPGSASSSQAPSTDQAADDGKPQGPPRDFEKLGQASINAQDLALGDNNLAYAYDDASSSANLGITAYSVATGQPAWHARVPGATARPLVLSGEEPGDVPGLAGTIVFGAFVTTSAGQGTSAGDYAAAVVAYDAATGKQLWRTEFAKGNGTDASELGDARVVGANSQRVLVSLSGSALTPAMSALLDARTGTLIWTDPDFDGVALEESVAVGIRADGDFAGSSTSEARQLWKSAVIRGEPIAKGDAGPGLTLAEGSIDDGGKLIDPLTGTTKLSLGGNVTYCYYDHQATTVCTGPDGVIAVDVATARLLWRLPDETSNRIAPKVASVWHGVVYADVNGTGFTLDARTGADLHKITIIPSMVNDRYGLVFAEHPASFVAHRATS